MKKVKKLIENVEVCNYSFVDKFNEIILNKVEGYGNDKQALKSFFEDLQRGGCISGMIGEFIYHEDCKKFYIEYMDELEDFRTELEEGYGCPIENRYETRHYTFVCWLTFEEYCYSMYSNIFEG